MIEDDFASSFVDEESSNTKVTDPLNASLDDPQSLPEIGYDDPRVRSFMDNENLSAEDAIAKVRAMQTSNNRESK